MKRKREEEEGDEQVRGKRSKPTEKEEKVESKVSVEKCKTVTNIEMKKWWERKTGEKRAKHANFEQNTSKKVPNLKAKENVLRKVQQTKKRSIFKVGKTKISKTTVQANKITEFFKLKQPKNAGPEHQSILKQFIPNSSILEDKDHLNKSGGGGSG